VFTNNKIKSFQGNDKSGRKSNWQYLFIKENRLKGNGFSSRFVP